MCKYTHGKRQDSLLRPKVTRYRITDDYRSIIKDLRTENKRLKGELRRYRQMGLVEIRSGPRFEITAHMLSTRKKRELEALLHDFTLNVTGQSGTNSQPSMLNKRECSSRGKSNFMQSSPLPQPILPDHFSLRLPSQSLRPVGSTRQRIRFYANLSVRSTMYLGRLVPSSRERGETAITIDGQMDKIIAEGLSKDDGSVCDQASCT